MSEPRQDMLPDAAQSEQPQTPEPDVQTPSPQVTPEKKEEAPAPSPAPEGKPPAGFVPYQSLEEARSKAKAERERREAVEQELERYKSKASSVPSDDYEDYDEQDSPAVNDALRKTQDEVRELKRSIDVRDVKTTYPQLAEFGAEFDEYLEDNKDIAVVKAAKLFLFDRGLSTSASTERKGLEQPTGGDKTPQPEGISRDEVERLRQNQPRLYEAKIRSGEIDPDKIY